MNYASFVVQFPEFADSDERLVAAKLIEASARMGGPNGRIWGSYATQGQPLTQADMAQGNLAAYYLICSPFGAETRATYKDPKQSTYYLKWQELMLSVSGGVVVAGRGGFARGPFFP